jgi:hypothetical protein
MDSSKNSIPNSARAYVVKAGGGVEFKNERVTKNKEISKFGSEGPTL